MRDTIDSIKTLYDLYASELQGQITKAINRISSAAQTSPLLRNKAAKRKHEETCGIPKAPVKETIYMTLSRKVDTKELGKEPGWQKVIKRRRKNKKPQEKKTKSDAIVITTKNNTSYADIVRRVETDPKLCGLEENVTKIRRTIKGGLILQLCGSGETRRTLGAPLESSYEKARLSAL